MDELSSGNDPNKDPPLNQHRGASPVMAKRLSVPEMLEAARQSSSGSPSPKASSVAVGEKAADLPAAKTEPPSEAVSNSTPTNRPLTIQEKIAAARGRGVSPKPETSSLSDNPEMSTPQGLTKAKPESGESRSNLNTLSIQEKLAAARNGNSRPSLAKGASHEETETAREVVKTDARPKADPTPQPLPSKSPKSSPEMTKAEVVVGKPAPVIVILVAGWLGFATIIAVLFGFIGTAIEGKVVDNSRSKGSPTPGAKASGEKSP